MLRACILDFQGSWSKYLSLVEFPYNNSYQATIQMAPYEAFYGRKCHSSLYWHELGERVFVPKTRGTYFCGHREDSELHEDRSEQAEELRGCLMLSIRV